MYRRSLVALCLICTGSQFTIAHAQVADDVDQQSELSEEMTSDDEGANPYLNTIIVTAQKKGVGEAAQDVPIALTTFNSELLATTLSSDLRDLGFFSPNTQLLGGSTTPGTASFAIRGLGSTESTESVEPTVGLVKDGLVYAQRYGSFIETYDLESVEILRGPQGTLFGRNVTAGVVNVRSRRPTLEGGVHGQLRTVVGSQDRFDLTGYADVTLVPDKLGLVLSAARLREDGTLKNINPIGGTLGDKRVENYRAALLIEPSNEFDLTLTVEQNRDHSDTTPSYDPTYTDDFFEADRDLDNQIDLKAMTYIAEGNIYLDPGTITIIAGRRETDYRDNGIADLDGGPNRSFGFRQNLQHEQTSVEIRFASQRIADRFDFTVGAFAMQQELTLVAARYAGPPLAPIQVIQPYGATQDAFSYAFFAQGDADLTDTLTLTLGGRYTSERKDFSLAPRGTFACGTASQAGTDFLPDIDDCAFGPRVNDSWQDFSPLARLTWEPTDNLLAYASFSRGFRSGGFNSRATANGLDENGLPISYDDESVQSYEIGFKSDLFRNRIRFNGAVFYNELKGLQRSVTAGPPTLAQTILNAGEATMKGIEFDITAVALEDALNQDDSFVLTGSYGYVDADYTFFDTDGDGISDADQLEFNKTPPHTFSVSGLYDTPVGNAGSMAFRVAYRFEDKTFPDTANERPLLPKIGELDASISFSDAADRFTIRAFAKNLTDEQSLFQVLPVVNDTLSPRPGRRFGLEASVNF